MAYFSNGTEGRMYEADYCDRCVHGQDDDKGCPVMLLHLLWNYDAVGDHKDETKETALNTLIPRSKDRLSNEECRMFVRSNGQG